MKPEEISKRARLIVRWFVVSVLGGVDVPVLGGVDVPVLRGVDVPVLFPLFFFFQHCSICVVSCVTIHSKDATHPFCSRPSFQRLSMSAHCPKTILVFAIAF